MRIFRYLTNDVLSHTTAVTIVLFLVVFVGRLTKYLVQVVAGDISSSAILPVMLLRLPSFFELILPLSIFIGTLLSLGRFYTQNEMVVLKACGLTSRRIAGYVFVASNRRYVSRCVFVIAVDTLLLV